MVIKGTNNPSTCIINSILATAAEMRLKIVQGLSYKATDAWSRPVVGSYDPVPTLYTSSSTEGL